MGRSRKMTLSQAVKSITTKLMQTEACSVSVVSLPYFNLKSAQFRDQVLQLHPEDDAVSNMDASEYLSYRTAHQLIKYRADGRFQHSALKGLEYAGYLLNGLAIAMILVNEEVWVATLIVLLNILSNTVAVVQYEDKLVRTNDAIVTLDCTVSWWTTLDEGEQVKQDLLNKMNKGQLQQQQQQQQAPP